MPHPTDKTNENLSPEKLNSPRQRRKITKEGPPSRAELEERKRMLDEYKRAREEKRRVGTAKRNGANTVLTKCSSIEIESSVELSSDSTEAFEETAAAESIEPINPQTNEIEDHSENQNSLKNAMQDIAPVTVTEEPIELIETIAESADIAEEATAMIVEAKAVVEAVPVVEPIETAVEASEDNRTATVQMEEPMIETVQMEEPMIEKVQMEDPMIETAQFTQVVPKWRSDEGFWLRNRVVIEYYDSMTEAMIVEPVRKPHLRLFKLNQIETQLACGHKELASAMLSVLCAPGQKKGNDPMLRESVAARIQRIRSRFVAEESTDNIGMSLVEPEPTLPFPKPGHFSGSDSDQDETGSKLAMDVEEASRRHSIILSDLCITPRSNHTGDFRSVQKAAQFLAEDEDLMASVKKRLYDTVCVSETKPCKTRRVDVDLAGASDDDDECVAAGSTVKYALLTPSKRIQEMLHTDLVISPVRRSVRNLEHGEEHHCDNQVSQVKLYDEIEEVDMTDVGYMPNRSIPGSPYKKTPKRQE